MPCNLYTANWAYQVCEGEVDTITIIEKITSVQQMQRLVLVLKATNRCLSQLGGFVCAII